MSAGTTSNKVKIADVAAKFDSLQVSDPMMAMLIAVQLEQLRQLTKIAMILSQTSGVSISDSEVEIPDLF